MKYIISYVHRSVDPELRFFEGTLDEAIAFTESDPEDFPWRESEHVHIYEVADNQKPMKLVAAGWPDYDDYSDKVIPHWNRSII